MNEQRQAAALNYGAIRMLCAASAYTCSKISLLSTFRQMARARSEQ